MKRKSTIQPRKQRKQILKGDLSRLKREIKAHLSKSLREKHKKRNASVITGDSVKVVRGKYSGKTGRVEKVNTRTRRIFIEGIEIQKADGTNAKVGIVPSNVIIQDLNLKDKKRKEILKRQASAKGKKEAKK